MFLYFSFAISSQAHCRTVRQILPVCNPLNLRGFRKSIRQKFVFVYKPTKVFLNMYQQAPHKRRKRENLEAKHIKNNRKRMLYVPHAATDTVCSCFVRNYTDICLIECWHGFMYRFCMFCRKHDI